MSAYACEPGLGSEIGVGWHWVLEMSRFFELWVLTRESNRRTIEPWIAEHPEYAKINFVYFDLPQWARRWKRGMRGVRIYYMLWQWLSDGVVKRTMQENGIDTYHLLTYGNAMWPASRYGMKQRFVWGPVSAGVMLPKFLTKHFSWKSRLKEVAQRVMRWLLPLNVGFRRRCKYADLILCKTDDTIQCVPRKWRGKCVQMTDVAVERRDVESYLNPKRYDDTKINYVAAGTLVGWRTMDVLLEAWKTMREITDNRLQITECLSHTEPEVLSLGEKCTDNTENLSNLSFDSLSCCARFNSVEIASARQPKKTSLPSLIRNFRSTDDTDINASHVNSRQTIPHFIAKDSKTFGSSFLTSHSSLLTIVGDGPERGRLERLVDELGVRDSVRFVGQVDMETYYSYIAQADVVVNPCFREGAVTVSFDSMAMGKPLICFDTGGYTHYFKPGYSRVIGGVKSREEAVERLACAMVELADRELIARMGAEAKRRSEELSWEKKIESIVNSQGSIDNSPVGTT